MAAFASEPELRTRPGGPWCRPRTLSDASAGSPGRRVGPDPKHGHRRLDPMQRTRCYYFYDDAAHCNKRTPGAGRDAVDGFNRMHVVLGTSPACIATASLRHARGARGPRYRRARRRPQRTRSLNLVDFHRLPGDLIWMSKPSWWPGTHHGHTDSADHVWRPDPHIARCGTGRATCSRSRPWPPWLMSQMAK